MTVGSRLHGRRTVWALFVTTWRALNPPFGHKDSKGSEHAENATPTANPIRAGNASYHRA